MFNLLCFFNKMFNKFSESSQAMFSSDFVFHNLSPDVYKILNLFFFFLDFNIDTIFNFVKPLLHCFNNLTFYLIGISLYFYMLFQNIFFNHLQIKHFWR